jgi:hypothetical protein
LHLQIPRKKDKNAAKSGTEKKREEAAPVKLWGKKHWNGTIGDT